METLAGSRSLQVVDALKDVSFPVLVMYPASPPSELAAGGMPSERATRNAPLREGRFPLVILSHGSGGSHLGYRTIGACLAKNGYVVATPEHPGNNRNNNELSGTAENLANRPRHVRLTIDAVASDPCFKDRVETDCVAVIGHSMGGYTALTIAGGTPWTETRERVEVESDRRVKVLILLAPATAWFLPDNSLSRVRVPILMLTAEHDPLTPRWHAELVLDRVPDRARVTWRVVENAGHFSFLSPFPPALRSASFPPSMDPEGFDREEFHERLNAELLDFLDRTLKGTVARPGSIS